MLNFNKSTYLHLEKSSDDPESLQSEIHNWLHSSKQSSKRTSNRDTSKLDSASDFSDSDLDMRTTGGIRGKNDEFFCLVFSVQNR